VASKIFVGNLKYEVTEDELRGAFEAVVPVKSVEVPAGSNGGNRGIGFIEVATPRDAELAIERLSGTNLRGRPLRLEPAKERAPRDPNNDRPRAGGPRGAT